MPTYEYACTECGTAPRCSGRSPTLPTTCAVCGGILRKVFSPVGIVFKGSGFYRTDSRGKPAKTDGDKAKKPAESQSSSSSSDGKGSSDSKASTSTPKAAEKSA